MCFALAVAFKNAKAYDDAIASYMKQADVQKQTGSYTFYLVILVTGSICFKKICNCFEIVALVDLNIFVTMLESCNVNVYLVISLFLDAC